MKPTLFIHVGLPKAASSFLQQRLFPELERQGKLHFLNVQRIYEVVSRIVYQDSFTYNADAVRSMLQPHLKPGVNVITVEWFSGVIGYKSFNTQETARRLSVTFPEACILVILRNQVDFAYAAYKQYMHQGGSMRLADFFNYRDGKVHNGFDFVNFRFDDHRIYWNSLAYSHLLDSYSEFAKQGKLKIFLFEAFSANPRSFTEQLLKELNVDADLTSFDFSPINSGYGKYQILIARVLNRLVYSTYNQIGIKPIPWIGKNRSLQSVHIRKVLQSGLSFKIFGNKSIKNPKIDSEIRKIFHADNAKVESHLPIESKPLFRRYYLDGDVRAKTDVLKGTE